MAYDAACNRLRRGEPALPPKREKPDADDIRRWYQPPTRELRFGDREGEAVISVAPVKSNLYSSCTMSSTSFTPGSRSLFWLRVIRAI